MEFDRSIFHGCILKGDLHGAINYLKQFPEEKRLYHRYVSVFERGQFRTCDVEDDLNAILLAYQQYYRDAFFLRVGREPAAEKLRDRLADVLGIDGEADTLDELEQDRLPALFRGRGLHFLGGKTGGWYGPYIWRTTETVTYDVELPDSVQPYTVKLLDGFLSRSWIDYLSFGELSPGGWADGDGCINCVKSAWDFDRESFRVSLLKHEAQHTRDLQIDPHMSSEELEYRAKLVELIYSEERNLLQAFAMEADPSEQSNGHAMAAYRIVGDFRRMMDTCKFGPAEIPIKEIQRIAGLLFDKSEKETKRA